MSHRHGASNKSSLLSILRFKDVKNYFKITWYFLVTRFLFFLYFFLLQELFILICMYYYGRCHRSTWTNWLWIYSPPPISLPQMNMIACPRVTDNMRGRDHPLQSCKGESRSSARFCDLTPKFWTQNELMTIDDSSWQPPNQLRWLLSCTWEWPESDSSQGNDSSQRKDSYIFFLFLQLRGSNWKPPTMVLKPETYSNRKAQLVVGRI